MAECCEEEEPSASALPSPAFTPSLRPVQSLPVGFTCNFVNAPKELRTECPICLYILREPHQATCCGSIYCKLCIERVRSDQKPCPTCRDASFNVFPDRGLRNALYGFKVNCIHTEKGCTWTGELRYMEDHLNFDPKPEQRFFGCEYAPQTCALCYEAFPRGKLEEHEMKHCPKRPYTCEYCSDCSATFEEVVEQHWPRCPERPTPCPNECGVYPLRRNLQRHLEADCELRPREPPPRPLLPSKEDVDGGGVTMGVSAAELRKSIDRAVEDRLASFAGDSLRKALHEEILKQRSLTATSAGGLGSESGRGVGTSGGSSSVVEEVKKLREEIERLRAELDDLKMEHEKDRETIATLKTHFSIAPVSLTLGGYKARRLRNDRGWRSPSFYTHPRGYRMCLLVDVGGPATTAVVGVGGHAAESVFMSVYLGIMRGEFDGQLHWPFRGSVTITLLCGRSEEEWQAERKEEELEETSGVVGLGNNRRNSSTSSSSSVGGGGGSGKNYAEVVKYHENTNLASSGRVRGDEMSKPWGKGKFIRHEVLEKGGFVVNDELRFEISKVVVD